MPVRVPMELLSVCYKSLYTTKNKVPSLVDSVLPISYYLKVGGREKLLISIGNGVCVPCNCRWKYSTINEIEKYMRNKQQQHISCRIGG